MPNTNPWTVASEAPAPAAPSAANSVPLDELIGKYSGKYGVDPDLVRSQMGQESNYNPNAVSSKGAVGLMQLMPSTAKALGVDPHNPEQNISGGIQYMSGLLKEFNGNITHALAAYNAGPAVVKDFRDGTNVSGKNPYNRTTPDGVPPIAETQQYVKSILSKYNKKSDASPAAPAAKDWKVSSEEQANLMHNLEGKNYMVPTSMVKEYLQSGKFKSGSYEDSEEGQLAKYGLQPYDLRNLKVPYTQDQIKSAMDDRSWWRIALGLRPDENNLRKAGINVNDYNQYQDELLHQIQHNVQRDVIERNRLFTGTPSPSSPLGGPVGGIRAGVAGTLGLVATHDEEGFHQGQVYHAFADQPHSAEEAKNLAKTIMYPDGHTEEVPNGPVYRGLHRLFIDPNVADLKKSSEAYKTGHPVLAGAYGVTGIVPVFGPLASHIGEQTAKDPLAGIAEGLTYLAAPKVAKEVLRTTAGIVSRAPAKLIARVIPAATEVNKFANEKGLPLTAGQSLSREGGPLDQGIVGPTLRAVENFQRRVPGVASIYEASDVAANKAAVDTLQKTADSVGPEGVDSRGVPGKLSGFDNITPMDVDKSLINEMERAHPELKVEQPTPAEQEGGTGALRNVHPDIQAELAKMRQDGRWETRANEMLDDLNRDRRGTALDIVGEDRMDTLFQEPMRQPLIEILKAGAPTFPDMATAAADLLKGKSIRQVASKMTGASFERMYDQAIEQGIIPKSPFTAAIKYDLSAATRGLVSGQEPKAVGRKLYDKTVDRIRDAVTDQVKSVAAKASKYGLDISKLPSMDKVKSVPGSIMDAVKAASEKYKIDALKKKADAAQAKVDQVSNADPYRQGHGYPGLKDEGASEPPVDNSAEIRSAAQQAIIARAQHVNAAIDSLNRIYEDYDDFAHENPGVENPHADPLRTANQTVAEAYNAFNEATSKFSDIERPPTQERYPFNLTPENRPDIAMKHGPELQKEAAQFQEEARQKSALRQAWDNFRSVARSAKDNILRPYEPGENPVYSAPTRSFFENAKGYFKDKLFDAYKALNETPYGDKLWFDENGSLTPKAKERISSLGLTDDEINNLSKLDASTILRTKMLTADSQFYLRKRFNTPEKWSMVTEALKDPSVAPDLIRSMSGEVSGSEMRIWRDSKARMEYLSKHGLMDRFEDTWNRFQEAKAKNPNTTWDQVRNKADFYDPSEGGWDFKKIADMVNGGVPPEQVLQIALAKAHLMGAMYMNSAFPRSVVPSTIEMLDSTTPLPPKLEGYTWPSLERQWNAFTKAKADYPNLKWDEFVKPDTVKYTAQQAAWKNVSDKMAARASYIVNDMVTRDWSYGGEGPSKSGPISSIADSIGRSIRDSSIYKYFKGSPEASDVTPEDLEQMKNGGWSSKAFDPEVRDGYARLLARRGFNNAQISQILPEKVWGAIDTKIGGKGVYPSDPDFVSKIKEIISDGSPAGQANMKYVARGVLTDILDRVRSGHNGWLDNKAFSREWNNVSPETKEGLFTPDQVKEIDNLAKYLQVRNIKDFSWLERTAGQAREGLGRLLNKDFGKGAIANAAGKGRYVFSKYLENKGIEPSISSGIDVSRAIRNPIGKAAVGVTAGLNLVRSLNPADLLGPTTLGGAVLPVFKEALFFKLNRGLARVLTTRGGVNQLTDAIANKGSSRLDLGKSLSAAEKLEEKERQKPRFVNTGFTGRDAERISPQQEKIADNAGVIQQEARIPFKEGGNLPLKNPDPINPNTGEPSFYEDVMKGFKPKNVSTEQYFDNLRKLEDKSQVTADVPGMMLSIINRELADNPAWAKGSSSVDYFNKNFSGEISNLMKKYFPEEVRRLSSHEAGHTVLLHKGGWKILGANLGPRVEGTDIGSWTPEEGAQGAVVRSQRGGFRELFKTPKDYHVTHMGGQAGEERAGVPTEDAQLGASGDYQQVYDESAPGEGPKNAQIALDKARTLLNGELAGKHSKLTDFFIDNWGKNLDFKEFKDILKKTGLNVDEGTGLKLFSKYSAGEGSAEVRIDPTTGLPNFVHDVAGSRAIRKVFASQPVSKQFITPDIAGLRNAMILREAWGGATWLKPIFEGGTPESLKAVAEKFDSLHGAELGSLVKKYFPKTVELYSHHEAGHAVLMNHFGWDVKYANLQPSTAMSTMAHVYGITPEGEHPLETFSAPMMGGRAAEEKLGIDPESTKEHASADYKGIETLNDATESGGGGRPLNSDLGLTKARELLNGELEDKHRKLSEFFIQNYGKYLEFKDFKDILKGIGIVVTSQMLNKLWQNYNQQKDRT